MDYYIPISRRLFEHQFWCEERTYSRFEAWLDLIQSARFEDTKQLIGNRMIEVKRGQALVSLRFLAGRWQWSTKKVNSFLDLLIQDKMIIKETPKETGQTVITICNYDKYNETSEKRKQQKKQEGNTKETPRKHQGNENNKEYKEKKDNNIPPTPPKGDGLNIKARSLFEDFFLSTYGINYYWTAKDAGAMSQLLRKLSFQREQKKMDVSDDSLLYALKYLISSITDSWLCDNFSVTNINSKFNEIVSKARKSNGAKQTTTNIYEQKRIDSERRKSQLMAEFAEADAKFLAEQEAKRKADCASGEIPNTFKDGG